MEGAKYDSDLVSQAVGVLAYKTYSWVMLLDPPHAMEKMKNMALEDRRMVLTPQISLSFAAIIKNAMRWLED